MTNLIPQKEQKLLKIPQYDVPQGTTSEKYLEKLVMDGLKVRYGNDVPQDIINRAIYELTDINKKDLSDYFLIVWDIVQYAKKYNILTGTYRGAVGSSIVAYALRVTEVDPIKYDLFYERFLNPERDDLYPYMCIEVGKGSKEKVIEYVAKKYSCDLKSLKIDIWELYVLSSITDTIKLINKKYKNDFDINTIPLNDKETFETLSNGDTKGIFCFESDEMVKITKQVKPENIEDISALLALYRPCPLSLGIEEKFIKNKQKPEYKYPILASVLKNTYGIIIYQEQITQIIQTIMGCSLSEADAFRQIICKKDDLKIQEIKSKFIDSAIRQDIDIEMASEIFDEIVYANYYSFNKSHSISYALISYIMAYLKCHYKDEFIKALNTNKITY